MDNAKTTGFSRRTVVKGAAWSVPVIAAAIAVPAHAASAAEPGAVDNSTALYYWNESANASSASLQYDDLSTPTRGTWSFQVSLRAEAWDLPVWPTNAVAVVSVIFDEPIQSVGQLPPGLSGSGTSWSYTFPLTPKGATPNSYFNFSAVGASWPTKAVARLAITDAGPLTWPTQGVETLPGITQFDPSKSYLVS